MKNEKKCMLFLIFILGMSSFSGLYAKDGSPDDVVAIVNNEKILRSTFDQSYQQNKLFLSPRKVTKKKVLRDLINRKIGIQLAKKQKIDSQNDVKRKLEDVMYHAQISKDLEPLLKKIKVSDSDVKSYYNKNKEYRTAHILLRLTANPDEKQVQAAFDQIMEIYKKISRNPDDFTAMANKFSQSSSAPTGGDLGFQPRPRLAPEYFKAINGKKPGFVSRPVKTQFGFHIIKVIAVKKFKDINKNVYKKIVYDQKRDKILDNYFRNLRKTASIKIMDKKLK